MSSKAAARKSQGVEEPQQQYKSGSDDEPSSRQEYDAGDSNPGASGESDGAAAERRRGFLQGGKSDAFAKAFSKLVGAGAGLQPAAPAAAAAAAVPILKGSKSLARRQAEEADLAEKGSEAKRLRLEMRQRGHVVPKRRGEDPEGDARERALQRTATRGVVQLFNAVARAQRQMKEAEAAGAAAGAAAKLGRAGLLAELRAAKKGAAAKKPKAAAAAARREPDGSGGDGSDGDSPGWDVLKSGFAGLQGGGKMKDWDRKQAEEGGVAEQLSDGGGSSGGDDEW